MSTKYIVNNLSGQTINGNPIDPKYKVYTALLTQSGGDSPLSTNTGLLTIGVTYFINDAVIDMDFTNVGAPNNNVGTYFVATGTNPNWGTNPLGLAILFYNEGAPVVTVLENTIGNIWFEYGTVGYYSVKSDLLFKQNKTTAMLGSVGDDPADIAFGFLRNQNSEDTLYILTRDSGNVNTDGMLVITPIEIRVYN